MYVAKSISIRSVLYYCPCFTIGECSDEKNIVLRSNGVCTSILRESEGFTAFLLSLSHNGTACNDPILRHSTATELEDAYRFDLADGYVDWDKGRVHLTEEQVNTIRDILKLGIARFCKPDEKELSEP